MWSTIPNIKTTQYNTQPNDATHEHIMATSANDSIQVHLQIHGPIITIQCNVILIAGAPGNCILCSSGQFQLGHTTCQ